MLTLIRGNDILGATCVLDEHLGNETVRLLDVFVVVPLANLADLRETCNAELPTTVPARLERVFRLAGHDDGCDEANEVTLACRVSEILGLSQYAAEHFLGGPGGHLERIIAVPIGPAELRLIFLEHALMFAHLRNVSRAQVAEPLVIGLR